MFCPVCGKNNPDQARYCGGCGTVLTPPNPPQYPTEPPTDSGQSKKHRGLIAVIIILAVVLIALLFLAVLLYFGSGSYTETAVETAETETETDAAANEIAALYGEIVDSGSCGDTLNWYYTVNDTLVIDGTGAMNDYIYMYISYDNGGAWPEGQFRVSSPFYQYKDTISTVVISEGVTRIGSLAFYGCSSITAVYYAGTAEDWEKISIGSNNGGLTSATIYCNVAT